MNHDRDAPVDGPPTGTGRSGVAPITVVCYLVPRLTTFGNNLPINRERSLEFYDRILGYEDLGEAGPFGAVRVNDTFNLGFQNAEDFNSIHYALAMGPRSSR